MSVRVTSCSSFPCAHPSLWLSFLLPVDLAAGGGAEAAAAAAAPTVGNGGAVGAGDAAEMISPVLCVGGGVRGCEGEREIEIDR